MNAKLYLPMFGEDVKSQIETARRTNAARDDVADAFKSPRFSECPTPNQLRDVMDVLACGLATGCWIAVAEGVALLQDLEAQSRTQCEGTEQ